MDKLEGVFRVKGYENTNKFVVQKARTYGTQMLPCGGQKLIQQTWEDVSTWLPKEDAINHMKLLRADFDRERNYVVITEEEV